MNRVSDDDRSTLFLGARCQSGVRTTKRRDQWQSEAVDGRPKGVRGPQGQPCGTHCSEGANCHFDSNDRDKTDPVGVTSQLRWGSSRTMWPTRRGPHPLTRCWPPSSPKVVEKARPVILTHLARHTLFSFRSTECGRLLASATSSVKVDPVPQILDGMQHEPLERVQCRVVEQIVDVPLPQILEERVELVAREVVCNARTGVRRQHGWTCPQTLRLSL